MTTQELRHSIEKLAALSFYDALHHNLEPINLSLYTFTTSDTMSERWITMKSGTRIQNFLCRVL